jgi:hypothetical protein
VVLTRCPAIDYLSFLSVAVAMDLVLQPRGVLNVPIHTSSLVCIGLYIYSGFPFLTPSFSLGPRSSACLSLVIIRNFKPIARPFYIPSPPSRLPRNPSRPQLIALSWLLVLPQYEHPHPNRIDDLLPNFILVMAHPSEFVADPRCILLS